MALPAEHGGWALTFEPILLGLLVAPSGAGVALGAAAMLAFVARTPLKLVLVDRWRHRRLPRTRLAARVAVGEIALLVVLLAVAAAGAQRTFWGPLAVAAPLVLVELWFDMRSRGRRLLPEMAGSIGIGSVAAAIVLAGGGSTTVAAASWLVVAARVTGSLPFVHSQLRRAKGRPDRRWVQDLAQVASIALAAGGAGIGWLPLPAAGALVALALVQLVLARIPPPRAVVVGAQQLLYGLAVTIVAGTTLH